MKRQFIDQHNIVDKEGLRVFGLKELKADLQILDQLFSAGHSDYWKTLHDAIGAEADSTRKIQLQKIEAQLIGLREFIAAYIHSALDSPERFELFVQTKAAEIMSGNDTHNYFWALQIRRDQVLSVVSVINDVLSRLKEWTTLSPSKVIHDPNFLSLGEISIEDRIYQEAEQQYLKRSS